MGCGRVGSSLATQLQSMGHSVAVIDQNREAFRRLGADFNGQTVTGMGFDRDTLLEAGIEKASAFAAVSSGDNSNIIAARLAREVFDITNVVARIYDPARAEIYQRLGIPTVATVLWTTDQIVRHLLPDGASSEWTEPSGNLQLCQIPLHRDWYGEPISLIQANTSARVAFITRLGEGIIPTDRTILQEGDVVHLFVTDKELAMVTKSLANPPEEHS